MSKLKVKSKSGARKRFRLTAKGKIKRKRANHRHILEHKSAKRGRRLRSSTLIAAPDVAQVERMLSS